MDKQNFRWQRMTVGVCYYPEHWPTEMWREDLRRMREAGISTVRVGEFAWSVFEPEEGRFSFELFDEFLALCRQAGMAVILGTPTAAPPAWLTYAYPEVLNRDVSGVPYRHGARRHYTYNSPVYRKLCARIVEQLAGHYGQHPAVVGWQIDNELNCEVNEFYAEADHQAFRAFVREKYGALEALNQAWGGAFWSQTYTDWGQIFCPRPVPGGAYNPHMMLDYYRFISESCLSFARLQADILRRYKKPGDFITTNGLFGNLDNHVLARDILDVYTYDSYPGFAFGLDRNPKTATDLNDRKWTKNLTETRSVCPHFGIMEQQSGACGSAQRMEGPAPRPGQLTLWAMQSVAQGADFVSFFRWRTCPFGTEMYWHGILDYDGRDNRKLAEVKSFAGLLQTLEPVRGGENVAAFALVRDYDNLWNAQTDVYGSRVWRQSEGEIFAASELYHTPYDAVYLKDDTDLADLENYPVLLYPHPVIMTQARAELLEQYVRRGGILILGCRSGYKDIDGRCVMLPQPGLLQTLTGTDVRDFTLTSPNEAPTFALWDGARMETPVCNDVLTPLAGTEVLARYGSGYYAGAAVLTRKKLGKGYTLHFGSTFTRQTVRQLLGFAGVLEPFAARLTAPEGVEVVLRRRDGQQFLFALNFQDTPQRITLRQPATLLYTGETLQGEITLPAFGTAVYAL